MTLSEITEEAEALSPWYHEMELFRGYVTQSNMLDSKPQWENNRKVRDAHINYPGKVVFDIGCMDGMWAFEAEALGAATVIAGDVFQRNKDSIRRFKLARTALRSVVELQCPVDVHSLDQFFDCEFDIIQCMGVLYHVQNPQLALHRIRRIIKDNGQMLLETAVFNSETDSPMMRYNSDRVVYDDASSYWFPNWRCLQDMLKVAGFSPRTETAGWVKGGQASRVCMVCDAAPIPVHEDNFGGCQS